MITKRRLPGVLAAACVLVAGTIDLAAQRGQQGQPQATGQAAAPIDLTGTWVSVVTEDCAAWCTPKETTHGCR